MPNFVEVIKGLVRGFTEIGLLLIALFIVIEILFGGKWLSAVSVVENLIALINTIGENGIVGLITLIIVLWLFAERKVD